MLESDVEIDDSLVGLVRLHMDDAGIERRLGTELGVGSEVHENLERAVDSAGLEEAFGHRKQNFLVVGLKVERFLEIGERLVILMRLVETESHVPVRERVFRVCKERLFEDRDRLVVFFLDIADIAEVVIHLEMVRLEFARHEKPFRGFLDAVCLDCGNAITECTVEFVELGIVWREPDEYFVGPRTLFPIPVPGSKYFPLPKDRRGRGGFGRGVCSLP